MPLREPFPGFPPPLTTRPEGLLSMLGLQTNGSYPQHLAYDQLIPNMDLLNWYLQSRAEIQTVQGIITSATGLGTFQPIWTVPPQEVWVLLNITLHPQNVVGQQRLQWCRCRANDNLSRLALSDSILFDVANWELMGERPASKGYIFRPSVQIGLHGCSNAAGNTFNGTLRFVRCQI